MKVWEIKNIIADEHSFVLIDREKFMREIAEKEIDKLPKTIAVNGGAVWNISDDNMQSGSFYDMIERC